MFEYPGVYGEAAREFANNRQIRSDISCQLADGAGGVRTLGEDIILRARVHRLNGFSAHAGRAELLEWLGDVAVDNPKLVLTHGEEAARASLRDAILARYGIESLLPKLDDVISLDQANAR